MISAVLQFTGTNLHLKKILPILLIVSLALSSCSLIKPKAGDKCAADELQSGFKITENANGDEMFCDEFNVWRHVD